MSDNVPFNVVYCIFCVSTVEIPKEELGMPRIMSSSGSIGCKLPVRK
jgi:hypothetical protein